MNKHTHTNTGAQIDIHKHTPNHSQRTCALTHTYTHTCSLLHTSVESASFLCHVLWHAMPSPISVFSVQLELWALFTLGLIGEINHL